MHIKVSSAICFNLDRSKILSSGNGLTTSRKITFFFFFLKKCGREKMLIPSVFSFSNNFASKIKFKFCHFCHFNFVSADPHSSVGSVVDLRTGGRWFYPRLGQYSFRGLMIAYTTGFILLSLCCPWFLQWLFGEGASGLERILCEILFKRT